MPSKSNPNIGFENIMFIVSNLLDKYASFEDTVQSFYQKNRKKLFFRDCKFIGHLH